MITKFISDFNSTEDKFQNGYCFYFALMLKFRFGGRILYEPIFGHFVLELENRLYDSTGDVTDKYDVGIMYDESVWSEQKSIVNGCIMKL